MLLTKRAHHCTIFQTLSALMKVHPINYAIFETTRSGFIQILHHFNVMKDNSSVFFLAQTSYNLDKNSPSKWNFRTFECLGENSPNSSCHLWNQVSVFLQTLHHSSVLWNITLLYFLHLNFICFGQRDLIKVQIFRLSTACMKISQIPYVIFQATCQFSFKVCITFQCRDT